MASISHSVSVTGSNKTFPGVLVCNRRIAWGKGHGQIGPSLDGTQEHSMQMMFQQIYFNGKNSNLWVLFCL